MKRYIVYFLLISYNLIDAQVGIATTTPEATLDIKAKTPTGIATEVDGILIPRVDRQRAQSMTAIPTSTIIYVNSIATGTATGIAENITTTGFYFWNGTAWDPMKGGDNTLDMAYDEGGPGAGKIITADQGGVEINGSNSTISNGLLVTNTNGTQNTYTQLGYVGTLAGNTSVFGVRSLARATAATGLYDGPMGVYGLVEPLFAGGTINLNSTIGSSNKAAGLFGSIATTTAISGSAQDMVAGVVGYTGLHNAGGSAVTGSRLYSGLFGGNGRIVGLWGENSAFMEFLPKWQVQNYETAVLGFYNTNANGGNNGSDIGTGDAYFSIETNITNSTSKNLVLQSRSVGNVGVGTANPLDKLHISDATSANTASLRISGLSATSLLSNATTDVMVMADANGSLRRANESTKDAWYTTGNATSALRNIGTTSNQPFQFISNNVARGRVNSTDGSFVWGATASPPGNSFSVVSSLTTPFAVNGYSSNNGSGVWGEVGAASTTNFGAVQGVYAGSGNGPGVYGNYTGTSTSATRAGVYGLVNQAAANAGGAGVYGYNNISSGNQRMGVLGSYNTNAFGVGIHGLAFGGGLLTGNNDAAVVGWRANNANYSGYFNGNHVIVNGTKSGSVPTTRGNQLLYCMESPEVWFEDFGHGQLINGTVDIQLDPLFLETVLIDNEHPMHVFVQVQGECEDVYVIPDKTKFTVKEKHNGTSNVRFSYRLVAKRLHFPDHRFGNDPVWGPGDTRMYSERAPKRPVDYHEMVKQDQEDKKNWKPTPSPAVTYPDPTQSEVRRIK
jgi:hypothetical protein